nr:upf0589 protein c32h8.01c [Quercus suber]
MATAAASKNLYHRRLTAEASAKACWICYKPSSTVLITPDQDDWFHICPGHLVDRKFSIPIDEEDVAAKKRKEQLDKEIEAVKKEYEEKARKKMAKRKQKESEKVDKKGESKELATEDDKDEKEKEDKLKELEKQKEPDAAKVEGPRIFELHKNFYQMRLQKKRDTDMAKKNRERLRAPFPTVPSGGPSNSSARDSGPAMADAAIGGWRLVIIFSCLSIFLLLSLMDETIVATALVTISEPQLRPTKPHRDANLHGQALNSMISRIRSG